MGRRLRKIYGAPLSDGERARYVQVIPPSPGLRKAVVGGSDEKIDVANRVPHASCQRAQEDHATELRSRFHEFCDTLERSPLSQLL